jgi:hypothetical protein
MKIEDSRATYQLLKLLRLKQLAHQGFIAYLVEPALERPEFVLALPDECVLDIEIDVFLPVLLVDIY